MELNALGYIGVQSQRLDDWSRFATTLLGMQQAHAGDHQRVFRMDERTQRLAISDSPDASATYIGWECSSPVALDRLATRLDAAGVRVESGTRSLCAERGVDALIVFADPAGNRLEAFCGPAIDAAPFVPGRPVSGFRTGPLGMGHVVLHVVDVDVLLPFYRDLLGFRITDFGVSPYKLVFFHLNGRHHSLAMIGSGRRGIHHIMVELCGLDDVGQAYDLARQEQDRVAYTLGRHLNDHVTSFYLTTPAGFFLEYGWGGLVIDPTTWRPHETFDGPSSWGHDRLYSMPPAQREHLLRMRLEAAAKGVRLPDPFTSG